MEFKSQIFVRLHSHLVDVIRDLLGIHAGGGHFNASGKVVIVVAQMIG